MEPRRHGRWWVGAFALFLALLGLWVVAVLALQPAEAGPLSLSFDLRSRLRADYSPDPLGQRIASLRLTIVDDVLRDLGLSPQAAEAERQALEAAMSQPVPTATARDFAGSAPFTATASATATATETPVPTPTPIPPRTPRPTRTPKPTETEPPPAPTSPSPIDTKDPEICCFDLDPDPGPLAACTISVTGIHIFDPGPSSGIDDSDVVLKYRDPETGDYVYFSTTRTSGGWTAGPGSAWDAWYQGTLTISGVEVGLLDPGMLHAVARLIERARATSGGESIQVWIKVTDSAGHTAYAGPFSYELSVDCP